MVDKTLRIKQVGQGSGEALFTATVPEEDLLQGPTGPAGPTGPQGIQGIQGVQGVQGLPGSITNIRVFRSSFPANGIKTIALPNPAAVVILSYGFIPPFGQGRTIAADKDASGLVIEASGDELEGQEFRIAIIESVVEEVV